MQPSIKGPVIQDERFLESLDCFFLLVHFVVDATHFIISFLSLLDCGLLLGLHTNRVVPQSYIPSLLPEVLFAEIEVSLSLVAIIRVLGARIVGAFKVKQLFDVLVVLLLRPIHFLLIIHRLFLLEFFV